MRVTTASIAIFTIFSLAFSPVASSPARADYQLRQFSLGQRALDIFVADAGRQSLVKLNNGRMATLVFGPAGVKLVASNARAAGPGGLPGQLPDGRLTVSDLDISAAWLISPTPRYGHGVLGDKVEAGGLAVNTLAGRHYKYYLPHDSVFEDLQPRIADLDGDGRAEVITIRSYLNAGAALAVLGFKKKRFTLLAETPAIGLANRWLNPVGVGDIDGDGRMEVVYVETPHIGGTLYAYRLRRGRLTMAYRAPGYSNHRIGSRILGLSTIADLNGDGIAEILVPNQNRTEIHIIDFAKGRLRKLARLPLPSAIASDMRISWLGKKLQVLFLLSNRKLAQITFR